MIRFLFFLVRKWINFEFINYFEFIVVGKEFILENILFKFKYVFENV